LAQANSDLFFVSQVSKKGSHTAVLSMKWKLVTDTQIDFSDEIIRGNKCRNEKVQKVEGTYTKK